MVEQLPDGIKRLITRPNTKPRSVAVPLRSPIQLKPALDDYTGELLGNEGDEILAISQEIFLDPKTSDNNGNGYVICRIKGASWKKKFWMIWDKELFQLSEIHRIF